VVCGSGQRAGVAASLLVRAGAPRVIHVVDGGVPAWERLGHPVQRTPPPVMSGEAAR
jgi:rhodanese-related sulfurtransferase